MLDSVPATNEIFDQITNDLDRGFFILHYKWGMTYKEISECFNIDELTIKRRLLKTMKDLKKKYES